VFTREFALSRSERITTAAAVLLSSAGYVLGHHAYLTRGVVGDLAGLVLLAGALVARGQRSRQEARRWCVSFSSAWCSPCGRLGPWLAQISSGGRCFL